MFLEDKDNVRTACKLEEEYRQIDEVATKLEAEKALKKTGEPEYEVSSNLN